jgi:hypothetical protein
VCNNGHPLRVLLSHNPGGGSLVIGFGRETNVLGASISSYMGQANTTLSPPRSAEIRICATDYFNSISSQHDTGWTGALSLIFLGA